MSRSDNRKYTALPDRNADQILEKNFPVSYSRESISKAFQGLSKLVSSPAGIQDTNGYLQKPANLLTWSQDFTQWSKRGSAAVTPNFLYGLTRLSGLDTSTSGDVYNTIPTGYIAASAYTPALILAQDPSCQTGVILVSNPSSSSNGQWNINLALLPSTPTMISKDHPAVTVLVEFTGNGTAGGLYFRKTSGTGTLSVLVGSVGTFNGVFTTSQIAAMGGIPWTMGTASVALSLGDELVVNGGFDSATGWNLGVGWSVGAGVASVVGATGNTDMTQTIGVIDGKTYRVTFDIVSISANGRLYLVDPYFVSPPATTTGTKTFIVASDSGRPNNVGIRAISTDGLSMSATIDNISVREVSGIHLQQGTTANKPIVQRGLWNLLTYSSDFSNAAWSAANATLSGTRITRNSTGSSESLTYRNSATAPAVIVGNQYTFAAVAKAGTAGTKLYLRDLRCESIGQTIDTVVTTFNLSTGDVASGSLHVGKCSSVSIGDGRYLCVINGTASATLPANRIDVGVTSSDVVGGTAGDYIDVYSVAVFNGTLTAQQIIDAGGIPVTTTAAGSNPDSGKYALRFDSTDNLTATIPAGWESATIIDAAPTGAVASVQNVVGTHSLRGAMVTGVNLVTNGGFDSADGWYVGTGSIASGVLSFSAVVSNSISAWQTGRSFEANKPYLVEYDYSTTGGSVIYVGFGSATTFAVGNTGVGKFSGTLTSTSADTQLDIGTWIASGTTTGTIDNLRIYEINPVTHARILVKGTLTDAETDLYKSLASTLAGIKPRTASDILREYGSNAHLWIPNQLSYIESTGQTALTVGNPAGLVLDSLGNIESNVWDSSAATLGAGWTRNGSDFITDGTSSSVTLSRLTAGKTYRFTANITGGQVNLYLGPSTFLTDASGQVSWVGVAANSTIYIQNTSIGAKNISAITVKEITGIHLTQTTTANKPILQKTDAKYSWTFDGTDSLLAGNLGITNACTIVIAGRLDSLSVVTQLFTEAANGVSFYVQTSGAVAFGIIAGSDLTASSAGSISVSVPFVITARLSGGTAVIRKNGVQIASAATATVFAASTGVRVGSNFAGTANFLIGTLGSVAALPVAVSDSDLLILEREIARMMPNGPVF